MMSDERQTLSNSIAAVFEENNKILDVANKMIERGEASDAKRIVELSRKIVDANLELLAIAKAKLILS